ncbi:LysE family transporter [Desulfuromonas carbonis]|uniref:LysE family transporter n=1 Tax=Desulfuromonas sp. DDH964 TaxID=1823759 RepID=UPI00078E08C1|nr:LysE family transporter [Desulfuromonas sp. DDH964]AMV71619.1 RhtB family transporter [Desulfuromonas sp. DDH964]
MENLWLNISAVLAIFTLAIISPGPNFLMVVSTTLGDSRRAGLFTALGVATGSGLFALAGLLGLILVINTLPHFATAVAVLGGGYLAWLGATMVGRLFRPRLPLTAATVAAGGRSPLQAYRAGLITNLTNPKAWAFYFSLFTLVLAPGAPLWAKVFLNLAMFLISFGWYALVALLISERRVQPLFLRAQPLIQALLGLMLIFLGGRLALSALFG